ncbi:MAG TPA: hypothetical protein VGN72_19780 [Tepidisphaeraceae bacterium]|jgi:hypothetical protein|nr:hypothetical protein [Tepidisphaeraceae bacterium]
MASEQLPPLEPLPAVRPPDRLRVLLKRSWADPWTAMPYLVPISATEPLSPSIAKARFRYDAGYIKREDAREYETFVPLDFRDWFVRIEKLGQVDASSGKPAPPRPLWTGRIVDDLYEPHGTDVPGSADQGLDAYGLEHLLDRRDVATSWVADDGQGGFGQFEIGHALIFNDRTIRGLSNHGNRSLNRIGADPLADPPTEGGSYAFDKFANQKESASDDAGAPAVSQAWSAYDIAEYLLANYTDPDIGWRLSGAQDVLDCLRAIKPPRFDPGKGQSLKQLLDRLFDRRRGFGWRVRVGLAAPAGGGAGGAKPEVAEVEVLSLIGEPVVIDDVTIPTAVAATVLDTDTFGHWIDTPSIETSSAVRYGRIVAVGPRTISCCTFSVAEGTLVKGWTDDEQTGYADTLAPGATADPNASDDERASEKFRHVYAHYLVKRDWDWLSKNGEPATPALAFPVAPALDDNGKLKSPRAPADARSWGHVFLKSLPLPKPQKQADDGTAEPGYREMFALVERPESGTPGQPGHRAKRHVFLDNPGGDGDPSCNVQPLDAEFGVELRLRPNHLIARGTFSSASGTKSKREPVYDYRTLLVTAAIETDQRLRVAVDVPGGDPKRVLTIDVADAQFWFVLKGTVTDVVGGKLVRHEADEVVRDDSDQLRQVAAMGRAWYGRRRAALSFTLKYVADEFPAGTFVGSMVDRANDEPVNSAISSRTWDFVQGTTTYRTDYCELDLSLAASRPRRRKGRL